MNMDKLTFEGKLFAIPERVVVDLSAETRRLVSLFGAEAEHILNDIINDIAVKHRAEQNIGTLTKRLYDDLYDLTKRTDNDTTAIKLNLFDVMITLEQTALNILWALVRSGLYLDTNYLFYQYDHTLADGSVIMIRYQSYEEFCDAQAYDIFQADERAQSW